MVCDAGVMNVTRKGEEKSRRLHYSTLIEKEQGGHQAYIPIRWTNRYPQYIYPQLQRDINLTQVEIEVLLHHPS